MKRTLLLLLILTNSLPAYGEAAASSAGAYLTFATDYRFRGISQTDERPAVQAGIDFQHHSGFFVGVWASNVEFAREQVFREDPRTFELDTYAGYSWELSRAWNGLVTLVRYNYPDSSFNYDYNEVAFGLSYKETLALTVSFSDDSLARDESAFNYELGLQYPLTSGFELGAVAGFFDGEDAIGEGYVYANVGVSKIWRNLVLDLRYHDTDNDAEKVFGNYAGNQLALSVSVSLR